MLQTVKAHGHEFGSAILAFTIVIGVQELLWLHPVVFGAAFALLWFAIYKLTPQAIKWWGWAVLSVFAFVLFVFLDVVI